MLCLRDDELTAAAPYRPSLPEDDLEDVAGLFHPALCLGHDLLGDDEHVALLEPSQALDRVAQEPAEIVIGHHLGDPRQREDANHCSAPHRDLVDGAGELEDLTPRAIQSENQTTWT
jgi:hypothetical protein